MTVWDWIVSPKYSCPPRTSDCNYDIINVFDLCPGFRHRASKTLGIISSMRGVLLFLITSSFPSYLSLDYWGDLGWDPQGASRWGWSPDRPRVRGWEPSAPLPTRYSQPLLLEARTEINLLKNPWTRRPRKLPYWWTHWLAMKAWKPLYLPSYTACPMLLFYLVFLSCIPCNKLVNISKMFS